MQVQILDVVLDVLRQQSSSHIQRGLSWPGRWSQGGELATVTLRQVNVGILHGLLNTIHSAGIETFIKYFGFVSPTVLTIIKILEERIFSAGIGQDFYPGFYKLLVVGGKLVNSVRSGETEHEHLDIGLHLNKLCRISGN